jgi:hypothetical protein
MLTHQAVGASRLFDAKSEIWRKIENRTSGQEMTAGITP